MAKKLHSPVQIGPYTLSHRVAFAPCTRLRSSEGDLPNDLMADYYAQRASLGGLLIAEAAPVSRQGYGWIGSPGIYADGQIAGWKKITDAVHAKGGRIFLQLWHVGRQSHPSVQPNGEAPVAPSAIRAEGQALSLDGPVAFATPRALELHEIPLIIAEFGQASARALAAGFDGVEIHAANGFLPDQFLRDGSNKRDDEYGGPVENRTRFLLETVEAASAVLGSDRVGVRISPSGKYGSMSDSNPDRTFAHLAEQLNRYDLAYLHIIEPRIDGWELVHEGEGPIAAKRLRSIYDGTIIAADGFDRRSAEAIIADGTADLVAFGRHFISNPDLPERLRRNLPLTPYDRATFYGRDHRGYTDYPFYKEIALADGWGVSDEALS
jgi:N-ethylmaleimide reductase